MRIREFLFRPYSNMKTRFTESFAIPEASRAGGGPASRPDGILSWNQSLKLGGESDQAARSTPEHKKSPRSPLRRPRAFGFDSECRMPMCSRGRGTCTTPHPDTYIHFQLFQPDEVLRFLQRHPYDYTIAHPCLRGRHALFWLHWESAFRRSSHTSWDCRASGPSPAITIGHFG